MNNKKLTVRLFIVVLLSVFSSSVLACLAVIHSISQPNASQSTKGILNYTCLYGSNAYCTIVIKKNGATISTTQMSVSAYHSNFEFDHGAGTFEITVNAYKATDIRGSWSYSVYSSATSSITISQPEVPVTVGTTRYYYDANGRLNKVEEVGGRITIYQYDDAGNRTSKTTTN